MNSNFKKLVYLPMFGALLAFSTVNAAELDSTNEKEVEIVDQENSKEEFNLHEELEKFRDGSINEEYDALMTKLNEGNENHLQVFFELNELKNEFLLKAHQINSEILKLEQTKGEDQETKHMRIEFKNAIHQAYSHISKDCLWHIKMTSHTIQKGVKDGDNNGQERQMLMTKFERLSDFAIAFMNALNPLRG